MAEQSSGDKTEQPTGHRLEEARSRGNIPRSQDVNSSAALLAGTLALLYLGGGMVEMMQSAFRDVFRISSSLELNPDQMPALLVIASVFFLKLLGPFLLVILITAIASNIIQSGWVVATKALEPNFGALSPIKGFKRIFSSRGMVELAKGILKLIVVSWIAYATVKSVIPALIPLMDEEIGQIIGVIGKGMVKLALRLTLAFAVIAVADLLYQKWKFLHDLKMSKQEVKEEHRQMEGDPLIKGKIRQLQMQTSMNRMIKAIPTADVVLANPVHLAVALQYDPATMSAPKVIAKGKRKVAERIKAIARENGIPVIEDPELARALYKAAEVGWEVPYEFYQAVAEVMAMVYRIRKAA